jgi:N-carbamoyl-L-amino-acid hydrolase
MQVWRPDFVRGDGNTMNCNRLMVARIGVVALAVSGPAAFLAQNERALPPPAHGRHINSQRLRATLEQLSVFGRNPEGGVTRLGFSAADLAAREYVTTLMRSARLEVRVDPAANLIGYRAGTEELPAITFGSHIDSVPHGGNYDGDVGSLAAIEVMRTLQDQGRITRHPLEAVIWANEEGDHFGLATFGSAAAAGQLPPDVVQRRDDLGNTLAEWLQRYGQDPTLLSRARIPPGTLAAFLELHIEQGPFLEKAGIPIGVVQGIVEGRGFSCVAVGFANHAGTTPMNQRHDALTASARAVLAVREEVGREPGRQVGTVGYMTVEPGAPNVIPGRVEFSIDLRDLDAAKVEQLWARMQSRFARIAQEESISLDCTPRSRVASALADPTIQAAIRTAASSAGLASMDLPSGACHDAQELARITKIGMIFVPSRGGISHSPKEFTTWEDVANGAEVLYRTVLLLDAQPSPNASRR